MSDELKASEQPVDNAQADTWSEYFDPETRTYTLPGDLLVPNSNQLEPDSREQLEDDLEKLRKKWKEFDGNYMRIYSYVAYSQVIELLDRQEEITERELCAKCEWPSLAAMPDLEQQERIAEQDRRIVEYAEQVDELTAERDELLKRNDNQADVIRQLRAEFDAALDDLARAVEDKRSHPF